MNTFRFSALPTTSSVSATVTMLVSAWFVLAGAAIFTDQHSEGTIESARATAAVAAQIPPEARLTIVVEARRSATSL